MVSRPLYYLTNAYVRFFWNKLYLRIVHKLIKRYFVATLAFQVLHVALSFSLRLIYTWLLYTRLLLPIWHFCVCAFGRAGNPRSLWCSFWSSGMHLSPTLNQSHACDSDQVPHFRWHSSRAGHTQTRRHDWSSCSSTHLVRLLFPHIYSSTLSNGNNHCWG